MTVRCEGRNAESQSPRLASFVGCIVRAGDSNPHGFPHRDLNCACGVVARALPAPPGLRAARKPKRRLSLCQSVSGHRFEFREHPSASGSGPSWTALGAPVLQPATGSADRAQQLRLSSPRGAAVMGDLVQPVGLLTHPQRRHLKRQTNTSPRPKHSARIADAAVLKIWISMSSVRGRAIAVGEK
jgi:hypothetical protein